MAVRCGAGCLGLLIFHFRSQRRLGVSFVKNSAELLRAKILGRIKIEPERGCWLWEGAINGAGYGQFGFRRKTILAHRASYEAFVGAIPDGALLRHKCDVRACCRPDHLAPGSYSDNTSDQYRRNRRQVHRSRGRFNGQSKITEEVVRLIRSDRRSGYELAAELGISRQQVTRIRQGLYWSHV